MRISARRAMTGRSRRRGEELVAALHEAALAGLDAVGLGRLTMEGIARRAGTPKTTLYRRWSAPEDALLDAIAADYPLAAPSPAAEHREGDPIAAGAKSSLRRCTRRRSRTSSRSASAG